MNEGVSLYSPGDEGENIKEGNPLGSGYRAMKTLKKGTCWGRLQGYENIKEGNPLGSGYRALKILKKGTCWGAVTGLLPGDKGGIMMGLEMAGEP